MDFASWKRKRLESNHGQVIAITGMLYEFWKYHNDTCYEQNVNNRNIDEKINDMIFNRGWTSPILRPHIADTMLP